MFLHLCPWHRWLWIGGFGGSLGFSVTVVIGGARINSIVLWLLNWVSKLLIPLFLGHLKLWRGCVDGVWITDLFFSFFLAFFCLFFFLVFIIVGILLFFLVVSNSDFFLYHFLDSRRFRKNSDLSTSIAALHTDIVLMFADIAHPVCTIGNLTKFDVYFHICCFVYHNVRESSFNTWDWAIEVSLAGFSESYNVLLILEELLSHYKRTWDDIFIKIGRPILFILLIESFQRLLKVTL